MISTSHPTPGAPAGLTDGVVAALEAELEGYRRALESAEQAVVAARRRLGGAWLRKGELLTRLGHAPAAVEALLQAHALGETTPEVLAVLARLPPQTAEAARLADELAACLPAAADSDAWQALRWDGQTETRRRLRAALEAAAAAAGPADPAACHNLALFHLAESNRQLEAGAAEEALDHAGRAVAFLGPPLTDPDYLLDDAARRAAVYRTAASAETAAALETEAVGRLDGFFTALAAGLESAGRPDLARGAEDLRPALRAELRAARLVRNLGGFPVSGAARPVAAGPAYVYLVGLEAPLTAFLAALRTKAAHGSAGGSVEPALKAELEQLFSPLWRVAVLLREGRPALALERLRDAAAHCRAGPARWQELAAETETDLLLALAEQDMTGATPEETTRGARRAAEALAAARAAGRADAVADRLRDLALGRAKALVESDRPDEAVGLLEAADGWGGGDEVRGALAHALTERGIQVGNEQQWEASVRDLRRALALNPGAARTQYNLSRALASLATWVCWGDTPRASALLGEAVELAERCLAADPANALLRKRRDELVKERDEYRRVATSADGVKKELDDLLDFADED